MLNSCDTINTLSDKLVSLWTKNYLINKKKNPKTNPGLFTEFEKISDLEILAFLRVSLLNYKLTLKKASTGLYS